MKSFNNRKIKIGVFDSGLGGLSICQSLSELSNHFEIHYLADTAFFPYGERSGSEIIQRCQQLTEILIDKEVELIVVACNTATAWGIDQLRNNPKYDIPFVGVEPYLNFFKKEFNTESTNGEVLFHQYILVTQAMANSQRFRQLKETLDPSNRMNVIPCPGLAQLIENQLHECDQKGFLKELEETLANFKSHQKQIKDHPSYFVLGCTHYPLIERQLAKILDGKCISPGPYVARRIISLLDQKKLYQPHSEQTGNTLLFYSTAPIKHIDKKLQQIQIDNFVISTF